jgi:RNA polymerase sigma-70 factor (sigma-E family)
VNPAAEQAFTEFAHASRTRLRRTAYLMCGDWERSRDHVQEALIRVYVRWPKLQRQGGELAYARRAVASVVIDESRRRWSRELPAEADPTRATAEDVAATVTDRAALLAALAGLPPRQRACVVLRYFEELDVRETAAVLRCSEGTVKSQTSRALAALRSTFESASRDELTHLVNGRRR